MRRGGVDGDPAQFGELLDSGATAEPSVAAFFRTAEGHLCFVMNGGAVDVAHSRLQAPRDRQRAGDVSAENGRAVETSAIVPADYGAASGIEREAREAAVVGGVPVYAIEGYGNFQR